MAKIHPLILFTVGLAVLLTTVFYFQLFYLQKEDLLLSYTAFLSAYVVNFSLAAIITAFLYLLREKQAQNLGFIFMGSSFVKFAVFFVFFYPIYNVDGDVAKFEFAQFFIPYAISLTVETGFLIKILNEMD